ERRVSRRRRAHLDVAEPEYTAAAVSECSTVSLTIISGRNRMKRSTGALTGPVVLFAAAVLALLAGCSRSEPETSAEIAAPAGSTAAASPAAPAEPDLEAVRKATERFVDVEVALAEGYLRDPMNTCETAQTIGQPAE